MSAPVPVLRDEGDGCPSADTIAGYVEGALGSDSVSRLELHLDRCAACSEIVAAFGRGFDDDVTSEPLVAGALLGRYRLLERIGRGGMGVVWAAYDSDLDRRVALKVLRWTEQSDDEAGRASMIAEAKSMARLSDAHVVTVHDVGVAKGRIFVAMEYVDGTTLTAWLRDPRDPQAIVDVFLGAARGLAAAHAEGLVHGDFKPDNVLVDRNGRARVADFGLSRVVPNATDGDDPLVTATDTRPRAFVGTPLFMAPEQFAGLPATAQSDQFAFCVALWWALFGARPFAGTTVAEVAAAVSTGTISEPADAPRIPRSLRVALRRGLAVDPTARHADMRALVGILEGGRAGVSRLPWIAGAIACVGAAFAWAGVAGKADACATPAWLRDAFTGTAKAELVASGDALLPYERAAVVRLGDALEGFHGRLVDAHRRSCEAARQQAEADDTHQRRSACLRMAAAAFTPLRSMAQDYTTASERWRALVIVSSALDLADCEDPQRLALALPWPDDASLRPRVEANAELIVQADLLRRLARLPEAEALAEQVLAATEDVALAAQRATALRILGVVRDRRGAGDPTALLEESLRLALHSGDDREVFDTLRELVFVAGVRHGRRDEAEAYARIAEPLADRAGRGAVGQAILLQNLGSARSGAGDPAGALAALQRAVVLRDGAGQLDTADGASLLLAIGLAQEGADDFDAAMASYERAHRAYVASLGPEHPHVGMALEYVGILQRKRNALGPASAALRESIAIREAALGREHVDTAASLHALATVQLEAGENAEAERSFAEVIAIGRVSGGPTRALAMAVANHGETLRRLGRLDPAAERFAEALALWERELGPDHPDLAIALLGLGLVALERGRHDDARAPIARAATLVEGPTDPLLRAKVEIAQARVLEHSEPLLAQLIATRSLAHAGIARNRGAVATRDEAMRWLATPR